MFSCVLWRKVASIVLLAPEPFRVVGQLRGDRVPFSGVSKSGRVWRKVPESDARSVDASITFEGLPSRCRRVPHQASRFFFSSDHKDFNSAVVSAGHSTVM